MKLDQETVVKHQFWFLLGGYFLVWLIAVMWMKFTYPDEINKLKDEYKKASDAVKSANASPVNIATFLPPWEKEAKDFSDHKGKIWQNAWLYQMDMYDWPEEWRQKYDMTNPQVQISSDDRTKYKDKLYLDEIDNLRASAPKWLSPIELKDGFDSVFKPMTKRDWEEIPTREEVWLAQEDFWVKRELLVVVWTAMALQSLMEPVDIDEKQDPTPKDVEARYRFRNKNWEITLNIRKKDKGFVIGGDSTIKNIHPSHHPQALTSAKGKGIWFNVAQDKIRTSFEVRGEPVAWNETKQFSSEDYPDPLGGIKWDKEWLKEHPILVSQGFDQTNCPIRRINAIELAKQDCRTFIWPLQPNHMLAQLDALPEENDPSKAATASPVGPGGAGGSSGGPAMPGGPGGQGSSRGPGGPGGPGGMMGPMMGGGAAPAGNRTPNNHIERDRYLQSPTIDKKSNPPSHHLPLAIQLIVEQSHIHNILLALANSRLRFQITQVEFTHAKEFTPRSEGDKDKKEGTDVQGPRVFTGGMPGMAAGGAEMMRRRMMMQMQMRGSQGGPPDGDPGMRDRMRMEAMRRGSMRGPGGPMPGGAGGPPGMSRMPGGPQMMMRQPGAGGMGPGGPAQQSFTYAPGGMRAGGPMATGAGADPKQNENDQQDDNLVELTVYGIATLYRAPDAPQTSEQSGQSGAPTAQPAQQPPAQATPSGASPAPNAAPPPSGETPPAATTAQPKSGTPAPATQAKDGTPPATQPGGASTPTTPKQPDKQPADQKKAPAPAPPPGGKK
jgi:hypothetical protein